MPNRIVAPFDGLDVMHTMLTAVMAWLCIILLLPGETFGGGTGYALMAKFATEDHWSLAFGAVAVAGVVGLATDNRTVRFLSVMAVATMHGVFAIFLLAANPISTGSGTYAIIAVQGYYLAWRRARAGI